MLHKVDDENQEDGQIILLQQALNKMHELVTDPASLSKWSNLKPVEFLNEIDLPSGLKSELDKNFSYWPMELQQYFKNEVLESVKMHADYNKEDLRVLYQYLKTSFITLPDCTVGSFPDNQLERAMKSVSKELDHYYGREEDDVEFPCWPR